MTVHNHAFVLLVASLTLLSGGADAATFMTSPNFQTGPRIPNVTVLSTRPPCGYCGPKEPPPIPRYQGNDPFDQSSNLNPGSGGGGVKPGKKPNLY